MQPFPRPLATALALSWLAACGGGSGPTTPASPVVVASPTPVPSATPPPTTAPPVSAACNLEPGPVTRYAIAPRAQQTDGAGADILVRALPGFDETWCVDKDKTYRLDFNSNQRNDDDRECCWIGTPQWQVGGDTGMVVSAAPIAGTKDFNYRVRLEPKGRKGTVLVQAALDGVLSHPWQSNSGYTRGPLRIESMSANDLKAQCKCVFHGNGQYSGVGCTK
jgi:hypothetical protein